MSNNKKAFSNAVLPYNAVPRSEIEGTVKWFEARKGIGMVTPNDGRSGDVLLLKADIQDVQLPLSEGEQIGFVPYMRPSGRISATKVRRL